MDDCLCCGVGWRNTNAQQQKLSRDIHGSSYAHFWRADNLEPAQFECCGGGFGGRLLDCADTHEFMTGDDEL